MSFELYETLTGVLALIAVLLGAFTLVTHLQGRVWQSSARLLAMAAAIAFVTSGASLVMSEVYGAQPCVLCWWQRIFMYPLGILLPLAAVRRDLTIRPWALALSVTGAAIAAWHSIAQRIPSLLGSSCEAGGTSCATTWVTALAPSQGSDLYLSIPNMALIAFVTITILLATAPADQGTLQ